MKKLILIILIFNLNLFAGNLPLKLKMYTTTVDYWSYTKFEATVLVDSITIKKFIVNRGRCTLYDGFERVYKLTHQTPSKYRYGSRPSILIKPLSCKPLEITIETDQGNFSWDIN